MEQRWRNEKLLLIKYIHSVYLPTHWELKKLVMYIKMQLILMEKHTITSKFLHGYESKKVFFEDLGYFKMYKL